MKHERNNGRMVKRPIWAIPLLMASSAACSQPPSTQVAGATPEPKEASIVHDQPQGPAIAGLPFAQGRSFTSLDEYLAFRRKRGAYDVPWYREVRPGIYELVTRRRLGTPPQTFTRAELERKFGFAN